MRNGKHYVQARLSPEEKDRFLRICRLSGMSEKLILLRMMDKKPVNERPPEEFWRLRRLLQRIESDVCTLRLSDSFRASLSSLRRSLSLSQNFTRSVLVLITSFEFFRGFRVAP